tara:strand:- start:1140 stop:1622 length:483 start_codon:yes stop_codon:yes gene_type:complete
VVDKKQMRGIINDVLQKLGEKYADPKALDLVYNTGLVESKYVYLQQIKGPARGFFQCEPWVAVDVCTNYLKYRESLMKKVAKVCMLDWNVFMTPDENQWRYILTTNVAAQIVLCRLHYRRVPKPLPRTLEEQAHYWKDYFNTAKGKGTPEHFMEIVSKYG